MQNLKNCFFNIASEREKSDFILTREKNYTYGEVLKLVKTSMNNLLNLGVKKGDRVSLISEKSPEQVITLLSIWSIGAIAVPINENLNHHELEFILKDSTPTLNLLSKKYFDLIEISNKMILSDLNKDLPILYYENISENDIACLIYTSGSTGNPKGVMLSHKNFYSNAESVVEIIPFYPSDISYSLLPYWHSFALTTELISPILVGAKIAITANQKTFAQDLSYFNPTIIFVVPRIAELFKTMVIKKMQSLGEETYKKIQDAHSLAMKITGNTPEILDIQTYNKLKESLFNRIKSTFGINFRFMVSGGAPLDINLQRFFGAMDIKIMQGYGLTEASPVISVDKIDSHIFGSCGTLISWITKNGGDFSFRDETGNISKDIKGELLVKGSSVMLGYWNHKDQSAKALIDGWLYTGDMGYFEKDKLFLNGRKSNMIVLGGGENIHPEFLENILRESEFINDIMIFGDKLKNLYAVVAIDESFENNGDLHSKIKEDIKKLTKDLSTFQKPKDFILVPSFNPENGTYTATQKIKRHQVIMLYKEDINTLLKSHGESILFD